MSALSRLSGLSCVALLMATTWSAPARAECVKAYLGEELINDLGTMTTSLRSLDEMAFRAAGQRLEASLACVKTKVPSPVFASAYRFIGAYHFFAADEKEARRWFRAAIELAPTFEWDVNEVEQGHPLRKAFDEERAAGSTDPTPIEGKVLNVPAGSDLYLDGRKLNYPTAALDRPHLLQIIATSDNTVRQVFFIEGNAFPEQFLRDERMVIDTAAIAAEEKARNKRIRKGKEPEKILGEFEVQKIERVRPGSKTPMMITGGVVMIGGAAIYGASFAMYDEFERAETTEDLDRYRSLTNTLVVAAGATIAVGIGIEYAGIMLNAGPGMMSFGGRF